MNILKSTWFIAFFALLVTVSINTVLLLSGLNSIPVMVEPPKETVFESTSVFWTFRTREIDSLVLNLRQKNNILAQKEEDITSLTKQLSAEKEELVLLKDKIEKTRKELSEKILEVKDSEKKNLKSLASTYGAMPPDSVVKVFGHMDDVLVVKILTFMSPEIIGGIFQAMANITGIDGVSPDRAARLSELIRLRLSSKS